MWILAQNLNQQTVKQSKETLFKRKQKEQSWFVGPKKNPYTLVKESEIKNYLDAEFYKMYRVWKMFHLGLGLPGNKSWTELPTFIIDIIEIFETEHKFIIGGI